MITLPRSAFNLYKTFYDKHEDMKHQKLIAKQRFYKKINTLFYRIILFYFYGYQFLWNLTKSSSIRILMGISVYIYIYIYEVENTPIAE